MTDDSLSLKHFGGVAPLFPLPNVVLFPQVVQPLHIFEPRYRQMTADALDGDRLIALVLLRPGWEADYEGRPALHDLCCLGRIHNEQQLPDGRYNFLLRGLSRARILEEVPSDKLYRSARLELVPAGAAPPLMLNAQLREQVVGAAQPWLPAEAPVLEQFQKLLSSDLPLGILCDLLTFALPLPIEAKQQLLEELDISRRAGVLVQLLQVRPALVNIPTDGKSKFPPDFSPN